MELSQQLPSVLLSNSKWHFLNHGAWHCLKRILSITNDTVEIRCQNEPEFLSVRYITFKGSDKSTDMMIDLHSRTLSAWIVTDRGTFCKQM